MVNFKIVQVMLILSHKLFYKFNNFLFVSIFLLWLELINTRNLAAQISFPYYIWIVEAQNGNSVTFVCEIAKFNLILLNLSSGVLDKHISIIAIRILNSNRVIVLQNRDKKCWLRHIIFVTMLTSTALFWINCIVHTPYMEFFRFSKQNQI